MDADNRITLPQYEEWIASGRSSRDAAWGLAFEAAHLALATGGQDTAIPILLKLAEITMLGAIQEQLYELAMKGL